MGAKHSKPRLRRNRRFSSTSRKRQAPDGSNDPIPVSAETWNVGNNNKPHAVEACKYCGSSEGCQATTRKEDATNIAGDVTKEKMRLRGRKSAFEDFIKQTDLKVDIPSSAKSYENCVVEDNTKNSSREKTKRGGADLMEKRELEQQWTIPLRDINKMSETVPREDIVRLISSIYEAVDARIAQSSQGHDSVRVRLAVTPQRHSQSRLRRTASTPHGKYQECRCSKLPATELTNRRTLDDQKSRRHGSPFRSPSSLHARDTTECHCSTKTGGCRCPLRNMSSHRRARHAKPERSDDGSHLCGQEKDDFIPSKHLARGQSPAQNQHRKWPKSSEHHSRQKTSGSVKQRPRNHAAATQRPRRKDSGVASQDYQHFHEAMYLRLRELQRQSTLKPQKVEGLQDSDAAGDESDFGVEPTKPKPDECSGEGYSADGAERRSLRHLDGCEKRHAHSVHHHHHYHHGISEASLSAALSWQRALDVKSAANSIRSLEVPGPDTTEHQHYHYHHHAAGL